MRTGTLYGIGVGPGDPELLTLKAVRLLSECPCIFVPSSRFTKQVYVADIVRKHARKDVRIVEVTFSLAANVAERQKHWDEEAAQVVEQLRSGVDVGYVTLGDPLVYSTYIYLLKAVRRQMPEAAIETVPGISSFSQCAALTSFALGLGKESITVVPTSSDLHQVQKAIDTGGSIVLMKIGNRLEPILDLLDKNRLLSKGVFVSRAGLPDQRVETDLHALRGAPEGTGNLAVILIHA